MSTSIAGEADARAAFERLLGELRPKLHRYCARMAGSVIDGEDVLQEALMKAVKAFPHAGALVSIEGWLFASPTTQPWISCADASGRTPSTPMQTPT